VLLVTHCRYHNSGTGLAGGKLLGVESKEVAGLQNLVCPWSTG
jgi:hypothetical protein